MAYGTKYYAKFKDIKNIEYIMYLKLKNYVGSTTEIEFDADPFSVEYPAISNKFDPIRGSGCNINLLSETSMQFIDLYTSDMLGYQIQLNETVTNKLLWIGYLNSELYSEPFDQFKNYPISLTGSDGLAILDRLMYVNTDGSNYTGISSLFEIMKNCLQKLNISWSSIKIGLSISSPDFQILETETILHKTYVRNDNYYDEDNLPMSCRVVLESILKPFGASIQIINGDVWITDNNILASEGNQIIPNYNASTFAYAGYNVYNTNMGDVSTIGFSSTSQSLNVISPINKQRIIFSPYCNSTLIDYDVNKDINSDLISTTTYGVEPYRWKQTEFKTSKYWKSDVNLFQNSIAELTGLDNNINTTDKYLLLKKGLDYFNYTGILPTLNTNQVITTYINKNAWYGNTIEQPTNIKYYINDVVFYLLKYYLCVKEHYSVDTAPPENQYFIPANDYIIKQITVLYPEKPIKYYLKVEAKCFARVNNNMGESDDPTNDFFTCIINTKLTVGNKKFWYENNKTNGWVDTSEDKYFQWRFCDTTIDTVAPYKVLRNKIRDRWLDLNDGNSFSNITEASAGAKINPIIIPLFDIVGNTITFSIKNFYVWGAQGANDRFAELNGYVKEVRLKDIKFTILDSAMNELNSVDAQYDGFVNQTVKDDGAEITLSIGTNDNNYPIAKGSLLIANGSDYQNAKHFLKQNRIDILESLLLRSIISNYTQKTLEIVCDINIIKSTFGYLTYNNYLPNKKFMITGQKLDYSNQILSVTMQEFNKDNLEIQKNY